MKLEEKTLSEKYIYNGRIINLRVDEVLLPNGNEAKREVVEHNGGVCVAPLTEDNCLLFVRQFRYPYKEVVLELPAGKLEKGEDAYSAGLRETDRGDGRICRRGYGGYGQTLSVTGILRRDDSYVYGKSKKNRRDSF